MHTPPSELETCRSPAESYFRAGHDFFRHFLDSPEQALLTLVLWTDMLPKGGGTFVAADSVPVVAASSPTIRRGCCPAISIMRS
jgi:hypothetical protein